MEDLFKEVNGDDDDEDEDLTLILVLIPGILAATVGLGGWSRRQARWLWVRHNLFLARW